MIICIPFFLLARIVQSVISDAHTTFGTVVNVTHNQKPYMKNIKDKIYFKNFVKSDPHGDANPIINFISP